MLSISDQAGLRREFCYKSLAGLCNIQVDVHRVNPPCKLDFSGVIFFLTQLILRRFKSRVQKLLYICEHSKTPTNGIYMLCFVKNGKLCKSVLITIKFLNELQTAARVPTAFLILPNLHSCFYHSTETHGKRFLILTYLLILCFYD